MVKAQCRVPALHVFVWRRLSFALIIVSVVVIGNQSQKFFYITNNYKDVTLDEVCHLDVLFFDRTGLSVVAYFLSQIKQNKFFLLFPERPPF